MPAASIDPPVPSTGTTGPGSGPSAAVVWFMAISVGVIVANTYYIQPLLADIGRDFGLDSTGAGAVAMITQVGTACGMLCLVPLGDTHERRRLVIRLLLIAAAGLVAVATAQTAWWMFAASFVVGLTCATVHLIVPFAAQLAPEAKRGRIVGTVLSGLLLGILLARTFSGLIAGVFGWRSVYWIAAGLMLILAGCTQRLLPRGEPTLNMRYGPLLRSVLELARKFPALREASLLGALFFAAFSAFWTTLVFFLGTPPYHYGSEVAGLFGLIGAVGAAGAPLVGRLADRHGPRRAVTAALVLTLLAFVLLAVAGQAMAGLIVGVVLMDLGVQAGHVANQTRIYSLDASARSRLNTFYMVSYFIGGALGSLGGAALWRAAGWYGVCGFGGALLAAGLAWTGWRGRSASSP